MFTLTSEPEKQIELCDKVYTVNDAFDNIISVFEITDKNPNIFGIELAIIALIGELPNISEEMMVKLYQKLARIYINDGDKPKVIKDLQGNIIPTKREEWYSFKYDAWAIYSGFMQAYGIDLKKERGKLRWCNFKALLNGLPSNTRFKEILEIRMRKYPEGKGTAKERATLREAKESVSYPGRDFT